MRTLATRAFLGALTSLGVPALCSLSSPTHAATSIVPAQQATSRANEVTEVQRFAVIIGANAGGQGRALLRYASTDAASLQSVLTHLGGVKPDQRHTLSQPTPQGVQEALEGMSAKIAAQRALTENKRKRFEFFFYYSGHSDETGLLIGEKKVPYIDLKAWIAQVPSDIHVAILDSCASGAFTRLKGGAHRKPFLFANSGNVKGHAFIASSSADEASQESDKIAGSFFTHFLVSGMRGAADLDGDKLVTINEAFLFARNETLARTHSTQGGAQHPAYELKLAGTGDLVLTDLRQSQSTLELEAPIEGRVYVRDSKQRLVAELFKNKGTVLLAVAPGTYDVAVDEGATLRGGSVQVTEKGIARVTKSALKPRSKEAISALRGSSPDPATPSITPSTPPSPFVTAHWALIPGMESPSFMPSRERNAHVSMGLVLSRLHRLHGIAGGLGVSTTLLSTHGWQGAVTGNMARGTMRGVQSSLVFNRSFGAARGAQLSGVTNIAQELYGAQIAFLINIAHDLRGAQVSTGINIARQVRGLQLGLINIGGTVKGAQIGLINIANKADLSIGVLPYIKGGLHLEVFSSDLALLNLALRFDAKYNYSFVTIGVHPFKQGQVSMAGLGTGAKIPLTERLTLSPDLVFRMAIGGKLNFAADTEARLMSIGSLRLLLNARLHDRFSLFAGPAWHLRYAAHSEFPAQHSRPGFPLPSFALKSDNQFRTWFGFTAGLRI